METSVRAAQPRDADAIARIYNQGIEDGQATFETRPRTPAEIREKLLGASRHPTLVAERAGAVIGWASASVYRERACYDGVAEFSIYVERGARGTGAGAALLEALASRCAELGFTKLLSRIFPENSASRALCARSGFREVGVYRRHGQLSGAWRDCVIVERLLGAAAEGGAPEPSAESLARAFVEQINARDLDGIAALLSEGHEFVDGLGNVVAGRETMRQGWAAYFQWVPDYRIEIEETFSRGELVALFGFAGGTFAPDGKLRPENRWRIPAAWRARVAGGRIERWQVFADNKPMHDLLARA